MAVSKRTRFEVLRRDNHTCRYCRATDAPLTVDHVTPVALGGLDDPSNLVAACKDCNAGKASSSPDATLVADVKQADIRWARAIRQAAEVQYASREQVRDYVDGFADIWDSWHISGTRFPRPADWRQTVEVFYSSGLPLRDLDEAVEIACTNHLVSFEDTWRYMCGVSYNKIGRLHQIAKTLLAAEDADGT